MKTALMMITIAAFFLGGCQRECVTKKDSIHFPIIISSHTDRTCNENGTLDVRENGSACILAHWANNRTYDANGVLVKYDDRSGIWPFYHVHSVKTENRKSSNGTICLFLNFENEDQF